MSSRRKMCVQCGGQGSTSEMGEEPCGGCAGTGRDTKSDAWSEPCRTCNGKGTQTYCRRVTCRSCGGQGFTY